MTTLPNLYQDDSLGNMIEIGHFNENHNIRSANYFYYEQPDDEYELSRKLLKAKQMKPKTLFENKNLRITFRDPYLDVYILNYPAISGGCWHYIQNLHKDSWQAKIYGELINATNK